MWMQPFLEKGCMHIPTDLFKIANQACVLVGAGLPAKTQPIWHADVPIGIAFASKLAPTQLGSAAFSISR